MHEMKRFSFYDRYGRADLYKDYDEAGADVTAFVRSGDGGLMVLDFSHITFLGYSYSKATVSPAVRLVASDPESRSQLVMYAEPVLDLEELEAALVRSKQSIIVLNELNGRPAHGRIVGVLPDHLRQTWELVALRQTPTTAELAAELDESLQNTNQRLKRLESAGLLTREKTTSPSGGWEWKNKVV